MREYTVIYRKIIEHSDRKVTVLQVLYFVQQGAVFTNGSWIDAYCFSVGTMSDYIRHLIEKMYNVLIPFKA